MVIHLLADFLDFRDFLLLVAVVTLDQAPSPPAVVLNNKRCGYHGKHRSCQHELQSLSIHQPLLQTECKNHKSELARLRQNDPRAYRHARLVAETTTQKTDD